MSRVTSSVALAISLSFGVAQGTGNAAGQGCDARVLENNVRVVRIVFEEILSKGRIAENEGIYHADFVAHGIKRDSNREEDRAATIGWRSAVPDLRMDVLRTVADCNQVAVHWSGSGTNTGTGNGLPATGKRLEDLWGMTIFRLQDGKIREEWTSFNEYPMLQQMGLIPAPEAGTEVSK